MSDENGIGDGGGGCIDYDRLVDEVLSRFPKIIAALAAPPRSPP